LFLPSEEKELQSHKEVLMRLYETAFLIAANLAEDETEQLIQQMAEIVTENNGEMVDIDKWGKRKLAYKIQKFDAAFYVFFHYKSEADIPAELERRFKQTEAILRFLTVLMEEEPKLRRSRAARPKPREAVEERMAAPRLEPESETAPEEKLVVEPPAAPEAAPVEPPPAADDAQKEEK
jgi:small subunit ribosomal protein S6